MDNITFLVKKMQSEKNLFNYFFNHLNWQSLKLKIFHYIIETNKFLFLNNTKMFIFFVVTTINKCIVKFDTISFVNSTT